MERFDSNILLYKLGYSWIIYVIFPIFLKYESWKNMRCIIACRNRCNEFFPSNTPQFEIGLPNSLFPAHPKIASLFMQFLINFYVALLLHNIFLIEKSCISINEDNSKMRNYGTNE